MNIASKVLGTITTLAFLFLFFGGSNIKCNPDITKVSSVYTPQSEPGGL